MRRKKEILDQLRAEGKLHEFGVPALAAAGIGAAVPYVVKGAKALWKATKWGAKKGAGLGAAAAAGAAASRRGGARPAPSGTRPRSLIRTATRSQPDTLSNRGKGASRASLKGNAEERKQSALKGFGKQQQQSNLGRRGEGKREVERR